LFADSCEKAERVAKKAKTSTNIFLIMCSCAAKIVGRTVKERLNDQVKNRRGSMVLRMLNARIFRIEAPRESATGSHFSPWAQK
jgi:hypothetical protein